MDYSCLAEVGCADGVRDAFVDETRFDELTGCSGTWSGYRSLREPARPDFQLCGDDLGVECERPSELCAPGWEICASDGMLLQLRQQLQNGDTCNNSDLADGEWVAAVSHCEDYHWIRGCSYQNEPLGCRNTQPICCGSRCDEPGCRDALFSGATWTPRANEDGCGQFSIESEQL